MSHMSLLRYANSLSDKTLGFVWLFLNQKGLCFKKMIMWLFCLDRESHYSNTNHIFVLTNTLSLFFKLCFFPKNDEYILKILFSFFYWKNEKHQRLLLPCPYFFVLYYLNFNRFLYFNFCSPILKIHYYTFLNSKTQNILHHFHYRH